MEILEDHGDIRIITYPSKDPGFEKAFFVRCDPPPIISQSLPLITSDWRLTRLHFWSRGKLALNKCDGNF